MGKRMWRRRTGFHSHTKTPCTLFTRHRLMCLGSRSEKCNSGVPRHPAAPEKVSSKNHGDHSSFKDEAG